ncbi:aminopeptidase P family protein [Candidatus Gottesmanbacteria bacterium]|nr:aminopeptidase P family protein [Candidatus Gottesmanbacteria bacterium]
MIRKTTAATALLITNPTNIRYLTGFTGAAPEEREAYVLLTQKTPYLFTSALYRESTKNLKSQIPMTKQDTITTVEISREDPFTKKLTEILKKNACVRLEFEENNLTVAELGKLKKELKGITLIPTQNKIEELRVIKKDDEITNIRAAATCTDRCFDYILGKLKPGISERQIAWEIESYIRKNGASLAFSPIVAFGRNPSMPHYQPKDRCKLTANNLILLDFGARVNGYCSDMTRVVFTGKPKNEWLHAYNTVFEAQSAAIKYLQAQGRTLNPQLLGTKADQIARDVIERAGFPTYPHSLGHGVGLDIHEIPRLISQKDRILPKTQPQKDAILLSGIVLTVEPGIYMEGSYGIRIEDLVLLKQDGIELLSKSPKNIIIL